MMAMRLRRARLSWLLLADMETLFGILGNRCRTMLFKMVAIVMRIRPLVHRVLSTWPLSP